MRRTDLAIIALISNALAGDPSIWRRLNKGAYNIVFLLLEVVLGPRSWF